MNTEDVSADDLGPRVSGKLVVLCMVGFAMLMTGLMIGYWEAYTRPFRDLQVAINERFPGCGPRVIGGRHRSGRDGAPNTLRVLIYVDSEDFNPEEESARRTEVVRELVDLASRHQELDSYELLEIRLMQALPEKKWRRWDVAQSPRVWREELTAAGIATDHWPSTTEKAADDPAGPVNVSDKVGSE